MSTDIGVAVIGAGYWGPNLVRNAQATPGMRLEYLVDLNEQRARTVLGDYSTVRVSSDLAAVLADPAVHAVAIATPAGTHVEVALAALAAGKHVLVEKPLASNWADGAAVVHAAEDAGLVLMLDHTYCYTPAVQHLRALVRSGELGELQYLDSVRINLGLVQADVDVVWDLAPHDLSILDSLLPDGVVPVSVSARGSDPLSCGQVCVAHLSIELSNGAIAHVHVNWLSPTKVRTTIVGGSRKTVVWDDLNPAARLAVYDRGIETLDPSTLGADVRNQTRVSYRIGDMVAPALPEKEALRTMMAEFHAAITEGRPALTDGRSGLRVLALLEAASESLRNQGVAVPVAGVLA
ncbi:gfo/Idh/MocA family oxidoreductase [Modestobacter sp. I12A-02628]|uniref:Gfo/Idh/MocA family oxidoreductase n=1 Tax=Goekera deserti TaxID=2497753 RepID=A0A7K3WJA9_9ACTN|nr:Gfo/Idh/MocA family oxidoreductase [Goekera deserti]MPQ99430.1 gfo/Idh/MocA family oxidoreductase [Goekera deserti]NDI48917.1 Gfo/Idh/MocA family oxidoreductase [Goekera deserti]NEL55613.1 Gfo/Idh/MocA family oxidoreductase [Goekera deserti]